MAEPDKPRSPFAGMADLAARAPVRLLSPDEIQRLLAEHRLYLETEYHEGHRANFASADLTGRDFSSLNLRGIKMDRAVLRSADFTGANLQRANLIGAILQEARLNHADLSGARLSGANLVFASLENACLAKADMEFALMAKVVLRGARLCEADMSGAQLSPPCSPGPISVRRTCVGPDFAMHGSTGPISAMHGLVARSWSGLRCAAPICVVLTYAWQSSTGRTCLMPIWTVWKASRRISSIGPIATAEQSCP
jgi:pentapeptide repeat protein